MSDFSLIPAIADYIESLENPCDARLVRQLHANYEQLQKENAELIAKVECIYQLLESLNVDRVKADAHLEMIDEYPEDE